MAIEEVEGAHRHGEVGLFGHAGDEAVEDGVFDVGIDVDPARGGENLLHLIFIAEDEEVNHVTEVALLVGNAAGNFGEEIVVDAGDGGDGPSDFAGSVVGGGVDDDFYFIRTFAGIDLRLIDADGKLAADGRDIVLFCTEEKGFDDIGLPILAMSAPRPSELRGRIRRRSLKPRVRPSGPSSALASE